MIEHTENVETGPETANGNGHHLLEAPPPRKALPPAPPKRKRSFAWIWLLLIAVVGFIGFRSYEGIQEKKAAEAAAQEKRAANRALSVAATPATRGDIPIYLRGLGNVVAYNTVNVKPRVDGPIVKVNFIEGQHVQKDEVLVEIDPRTYQAAVDQAVGQLARDQAQLNDAKVNLARYQKLWDEQVIAKQQLDTQAATVGQYQGTIEADKANIETAQLNLNFTKVRAPIAGRIGLRQVDIGNIVHATDTTALAVITQMQPISVLFTIPADQLQPVLAKLRAGAKLPVYAYDRADVNRIASGTLETVDNQIDPNTGTSRLKAVFNNEDEALFPQQFVNCRLLLDTRHGVTLIPSAAVQLGPQGPYVYVVNANSTASMRQITEGATEGNEVQVTSGVAPGDVVITDGQDKLQEGSKVEVRAGSAPVQGGVAGGITGSVTGTGAPRGARGVRPNLNGIPSGRPGGPGSQPAKGPAR
jgi:multidrug efflux system membrane fusion protein